MIYQADGFEIKAQPIDREQGRLLCVAVAIIGSREDSEECEMRAVLTPRAARRFARMLERVARATEHAARRPQGYRDDLLTP